MVQFRKKLLTSLLIIAALCPLFLPVAAQATGLAEKQAELKRVEQKLREQQKKLSQTKKQEKSVLQDLAAIESKLSQTESRLKQIEGNLSATQNKIEVTRRDLQKAEEEMAAQRGVLHQRMVNIYKNGRVSYLEVLLGASTFSDFLNRMSLLKEIASQDVELFEQIKARKQEIEEKKNYLEAKERELKALQAQHEHQKIQYRASALERENMLANISRQKDQLEAAIDELERISQELEKTIQELLRKNSGSKSNYTGGVMSWPTRGPVTSPFGWRIHPIFNKKKFHSGIDIGAPSGQSVVAAADGTVIYSGWVTGYGKTLIIDHGGGITTLYAHNSSLLAGVGEEVKRGQTVSKVGSTGYSTGPHLHFEVRVNGKPTDPMGYL